MRQLKLIFAAIVLISPFTANAGVIAIFSDINSMNLDSPGRNQMLTNLLGGGTNVLVSKQNNASYNTDFAGFYNSLAGVTGTFTSADLGASDLVGVDLLFINNGCCSASGQPYSASEIDAIADYLLMGGSLGLVSEPCCGATPGPMNDFLAAIGSSMSFGNHRSGGTTVILDTFLTAGVTNYLPTTFNPIFGGTAAVTQGGFAAVAFEELDVAAPVSEPGTLALLGIGLLAFGLRRRRN